MSSPWRRASPPERACARPPAPPDMLEGVPDGDDQDDEDDELVEAETEHFRGLRSGRCAVKSRRAQRPKRPQCSRSSTVASRSAAMSPGAAARSKPPRARNG